MPLQYPPQSPYNPYIEPKPITNWPKILLIGLGILVLIVIIYFILTHFGCSRFYQGDCEVIPLPSTSNGNLYPCSSDSYNCGNFTTQAWAQYVYNYCISQGNGDIHQLDGDGNGKACENLG